MQALQKLFFYILHFSLFVARYTHQTFTREKKENHVDGHSLANPLGTGELLEQTNLCNNNIGLPSLQPVLIIQSFYFFWLGRSLLGPNLFI